MATVQAILSRGGRLFLGLCLVAGTVRAGDADERALLAIWKTHMGALSNHVEVIAQCRKFEADMARSTYVPVVRGIGAWHLLAAGRNDEALTSLNAMLAEAKEPMAQAGNAMALRWLTRLDREKVCAALLAYYAKHVFYPETLAVFTSFPLPAEKKPPLKDRWDQSWAYSLAEFKQLKGLQRHRYTIRSRELGVLTDLKKMLKVPYAGRITLKPLRVMTIEGSSVCPVEFDTGIPKTARVTLTEGSDYVPKNSDLAKITFASLGMNVIVLSDGDHWLVIPRPPGGGWR